MGSFRITCNQRGQKLGYDARRYTTMPFVSVGFPAATKEQSLVEYRWRVTAIYPAIAGIEKNPRYDGFRRNFLNILQVNPRLAMLANNSSSDTCGFCVFEYAELARRAPPLAEGITALDLIRMTVDRHLDGVLTYGMTGYVPTPEYPDLIAENCPYDSLDTDPSLLMSAAHYADGAHWAKRRWPGLRRRIDKMLALDRDGDGLIEYPLSGNAGIWAKLKRNTVRPANWWDTIGYPMLKSYAAGEFQGFGPDKHSKDWRTWKGESWGYEGLLVDNYLPLLAVLDDGDQERKEGQHNGR
jgi:hypothetical protein